MMAWIRLAHEESFATVVPGFVGLCHYNAHATWAN